MLSSLSFLPHSIDRAVDLESQFKIIFGSEEAKEVSGIVYFFITEKPVPRFKGESNIIYIGQSSQSLHKRYYRYAQVLANEANSSFYMHVVDEYGGIRIGYIPSDDPIADERKYFNLYYEEHLEYPPKSKV